VGRDQAPVQIEQLPGRLGARGVVDDDPPAANDVELLADLRDVRLQVASKNPRRALMPAR
jgi:hypothetical protein